MSNIHTETYGADERDTFPRLIAMSGTASSDPSAGSGKAVIGVNTAFTQQISVNDWIYSQAQTEYRRVVEIVNDELLYIDEPFSANIIGDSPCRIKDYGFCKINMTIYAFQNLASSGGILINGKLIYYQTASTNHAPELTMSWSKDADSKGGIRNHLFPIRIDTKSQVGLMKVVFSATKY